jgi:hypothetical protein
VKPTFKLPDRRPVDDWVKGAGEGAATSQPVSPQPPEPKIKLARLTIDLNPELHAKFKAACAMRRTRMIDEVRDFIEGYIQNPS